MWNYWQEQAFSIVEDRLLLNQAFYNPFLQVKKSIHRLMFDFKQFGTPQTISSHQQLPPEQFSPVVARSGHSHLHHPTSSDRASTHQQANAVNPSSKNHRNASTIKRARIDPERGELGRRGFQVQRTDEDLLWQDDRGSSHLQDRANPRSE